MKKLLWVCLLCFSGTFRLLGQNMPQFDHVKLSSKKDYKQADSVVMQVSNHLLATPINVDTATRLKSAAFLMKWMEGTNDYTFIVNENTTKAFINNINLMAVYMAALCKTALHHKTSVNSKTIVIEGTKLLITYVNNSNNNVAMTSQLKELFDANNRGELESFLNL
jgi:hypothetical protein